jgi:DNA-binding NarL/FixJ family response regulator
MGHSVFVVDDDPAFRRLAERMLTAVGLAVAGEAETAGAAVAAIAVLMPDGILVDVGLPDRDGVSLAHELTALPWQPRVVLTSTDPDAATPGEVSSSGAAAFIPKAQLPNTQLDRLLRSQA